MKIVTLLENKNNEKDEFRVEHGLSFYIETEKNKILFDTGQTGMFIENAKKMNVDISNVDGLFLSHSHYDHCGGVKSLLETYNNKPKLIVSEYFFSNMNKYRKRDDGNNKYIGIDFDEEFILKNGLDIEYVKNKVTEVYDGVYIFTDFDRNTEYEKNNSNLIYTKKDKEIVDPFEDEISVGIDTKNGLVILLGCSHPGIINIIESIRSVTGKKIYGIIGGSHLKEADDLRIKKTIDYFKGLDIKILGLSHCTGDIASSQIQENISFYSYNKTGDMIIDN